MINRSRAAELFVTPLMLHRLLHAENRPADTTYLRRIFIGSGSPQSALLCDAADAFGPIIALGAGTPETSIFAYKKFDRETHVFGQIGPAVCGITAAIEYSEQDHAGQGQIGRLKLKVPEEQRFVGYLNRGPAYDADGWVYPGFLASQDAMGEVTKHGRTDDRLSLGGTRYFSGKIEDLLEQHPSVAAICALRVFDVSGQEALGLVVVGNGPIDTEDLARMTKRGLPGIGAVLVREIAALPTDVAGNVDRVAVQDWWASS